MARPIRLYHRSSIPNSRRRRGDHKQVREHPYPGTPRCCLEKAQQFRGYRRRRSHRQVLQLRGQMHLASVLHRLGALVKSLGSSPLGEEASQIARIINALNNHTPASGATPNPPPQRLRRAGRTAHKPTFEYVMSEPCLIYIKS
ncbi:unnamed protein product [Macrosiphum euphorbiae]|uniref:Uncharacterized protein n=1 Tax=Macrosiphum euphorbiae TaxID=13131 RepID=A0AAV0W6U7_9HEMI|nr:unnamed protein product [Macrosiphum euphorbiae]